MPKCSIEAIKDELAKLKAGGFKCAVAYLEMELKKRENSTGKKAKNDTPKHRSWRKASAKYRLAHEAKDKQTDEPATHWEPVDD
jgi:hypothetical protein